MGLIAAFAALYYMLDYERIAQSQGVAPLKRDVIIGIALVALLLEGCRRVIGPALSVIALAFILYAFLGPHMPSILAFGGVSLNRFIGQMTLSDEGVYGIPLRVSAYTVFLFVLFGAMLDRAGGGAFFTRLALSLLGGFRGGPAKAAVLSSGLTGMVSGSSIANIVTTGTFTIPLNPRNVASGPARKIPGRGPRTRNRVLRSTGRFIRRWIPSTMIRVVASPRRSTPSGRSPDRGRRR